MSIQKGADALIGAVYRSFDQKIAAKALKNMRSSRQAMSAQRKKYRGGSK